MLCKYREIGGKPREGLHKLRIPIIDLAFWDVLGTVLIGYVLVRSFGLNPIMVAGALVLITIFVHWLFCVPTKLNVFLGLAEHVQKRI